MRLFRLVFLVILIGVGAVHAAGKPASIPVFWGLLGSYPAEDSLNPYTLTRDDTTMAVGDLLYSIRRDFKSVDVLTVETGLPRAEIERKLRQLQACDLVVRRGDSFAVNFPFWDAPLRDTINQLGLALAAKIVGIIEQELPHLKADVAQSTLPQQGYTWDKLALIIVGGLLMDTGINDRGLRMKGIFAQLRDTPERPGGYHYWYRAVEGGWGPYWKFGHNQSRSADRTAWFCRFFGGRKGRQEVAEKVWEADEPWHDAVIFPLIRTGRTLRNQIAVAGMPPDSVAASLKRMIEAQVIRVSGDTIRPGFPIFGEKELQTLLPDIDRICTRIIDSVYTPFLPVIQTTWPRVAPRNWTIPNVDRFFVREVFDRPYNLVLHLLIERGLLPMPPVEPPFCYFGINGDYEIL